MLPDDLIEAKIDVIIEITHGRIRRVFLASDGDRSHNGRHNAFMAFWEAIYKEWGFKQMLRELQKYGGLGPLSDMLHLGKTSAPDF
jgi:hypothetical protein